METAFRTRAEITALYEKYVDLVYRLCYTMLRQPADAEDAVQTTFIKLMKHTAPFADEGHEKAWLIVTASNTCRDLLRSARTAEEPLEDHQDTLTGPEPGSHQLLELVLALPLRYRTVIYLYYYEGYTTPEIAEMLEKPASTIRNHLHEARQLLRVQLEEPQ